MAGACDIRGMKIHQNFNREIYCLFFVLCSYVVKELKHSHLG